MAPPTRLDSSGRTRFLLALTLSTVTAVAVAAPLAVEALRADEVRIAGLPDQPTASTPAPDDEDGIDRQLSSDGDSKGGIGSRPPTKAVGQTTKSETPSPRVTSPPAGPDESVLTNPTVDVDPEGEGPVTTDTTVVATTDTTDPTTTDTTESTTTTETTVETDPTSSTTSSSSTSTTPTTITAPTTTGG